MSVWIVHDDEDGSVVSVHDSPESAWYLLLGRESTWSVREWELRSDRAQSAEVRLLVETRMMLAAGGVPHA
jgi:hypothetical protein